MLINVYKSIFSLLTILATIKISIIAKNTKNKVIFIGQEN